MLVYGVEGDRNAAALVKDSKSYIEIAKFVQAYTTIVQNPNEFLSEVGEEPIDTKTDILSWKQLVKIMTQCDLGFDPVPTEKQLVSYYSYAKQIGSIKKEEKVIASVSDVAEAQKHYYNFIDAETEKANVMYNKQHEITQNRMREVETIDANLKKMKMKNTLYFCLMMFSVFFIGFGFISIFVDIGISNKVFSFIFIILGLIGFYFSDKVFIKTKKDYFGYKKSTRSAVSRTERTCRDEKVLRDKLAKYEEDLKIAKYELADKDKRFDVEKNIERLNERNKYYRMFRARDGLGLDGYQKHKMSLLDELSMSGPFGKDGLSSLFGEDGKLFRRNRHKDGLPSFEANENMRGFRGRGIIDERPGFGVPGKFGSMVERGLNSVNSHIGNALKPIKDNAMDWYASKIGRPRRIREDLSTIQFNENQRNTVTEASNNLAVIQEQQKRAQTEQFTRAIANMDTKKISSTSDLYTKLDEMSGFTSMSSEEKDESLIKMGWTVDEISPETSSEKQRKDQEQLGVETKNSAQAAEEIRKEERLKEIDEQLQRQ